MDNINIIKQRLNDTIAVKQSLLASNPQPPS